jgi:hypothetical protein
MLQTENSKRKEYFKEYGKKNREVLNRKQREWTKKNPEKRKAIVLRCNQNNPDRHKKYHQQLRFKVLFYYGKGKIECACCGEQTYEFLAIDHINGGGTKERKEAYGNICQLLWNKKLPDGYQVLCHNCNMAKGLYGKCPHNNKSCSTHYTTSSQKSSSEITAQLRTLSSRVRCSKTGHVWRTTTAPLLRSGLSQK